MSSTGTMTSTSSGLRTPASTIVTGRGWPSASRPPRKRAISSSGRCVADSPMRCGGRSQMRVEPLEREREVGAALGGGDRVDLVDDHRLDVAQRLARLRREHEVERLGRGDEDVGRVADEAAALVGARVAGAHADGRLVDRRRRGARPPAGCRRAAPAGSSRRRPRARAAATRRAAACACPLVGRRLGHQPVDAPQERGERLARAGRGEDQRVVARGDGRPPLRLRLGRARGTSSRTTPAPAARTPSSPRTPSTPSAPGTHHASR